MNREEHAPSSKGRLGVLISGRGSNLQALMEAIEERRLHAEIRVVISNRPEAAGLVRAQHAGIETVVVSPAQYADRDAYDDALVEALRSRDVSLVCLAGFMRVLGPRFCAAFPDAVLNIHPSLLPAFPGIHAQRQALAHGVRVSGATVHFVTPELDDGPIVVQEAVPVIDGDTEETLSTRILAVEHRLYPMAVEQILTRRWRISGRRVVFGSDDPIDAR